jgi:hypothetical protein
MIVLLGHLHRGFTMGYMAAARARGYQPGTVPVIQVGDLGWSTRLPNLSPPVASPFH